jgi:hypothetical protein
MPVASPGVRELPLPHFRRLQLEGFQRILLDEVTGLLRDHFALICATRSTRRRFAEDCVRLKRSAEEATLAADADHGLRAAVVLGPSKSSEGTYMY